MAIRREISDDPARPPGWPAHLDPAKGWRRCRKYSGFYCLGYLHDECRDPEPPETPVSG